MQEPTQPERRPEKHVGGSVAVTLPKERPAPPAKNPSPKIVPGGMPGEKKVVRLPAKVPAPFEPRSGLSEFSRQVWRIGLLAVGIPTLCSTLYFGLWASKQYVSEIRFAIRTAESSGSSGGLGAGGMSGIMASFTGGSSNLIADSYILIDYLTNREIVEKLDKEIGLRKLYSTTAADFFSRFTGWWGDAESIPIEHFVNYWQKRITTTYDLTTSIITVQIRGFTPADAQRIGSAVRNEAESLVNKLSDKAMEDAVKASKAEVLRSETRVQLIRGLMRRFRDKEQVADPVAAAGNKQTNMAALEQQLAQINTALNFRRPFLAESSPTMITLRARAEALEKEIAKARTVLGSDDKAAYSGTLATYDDLETQRQFAQQALISSLAMLEQARNNADRLRRYLAVYEEPKVPQYAAYPKVLANILITFFVSFIAFLLLLMIYQGVREHTRG
jgi:capsular polysaccharide transport system permease protein